MVHSVANCCALAPHCRRRWWHFTGIGGDGSDAKGNGRSRNGRVSSRTNELLCGGGVGDVNNGAFVVLWQRSAANGNRKLVRMCARADECTLRSVGSIVRWPIGERVHSNTTHTRTHTGRSINNPSVFVGENVALACSAHFEWQKLSFPLHLLFHRVTITQAYEPNTRTHARSTRKSHNNKRTKSIRHSSATLAIPTPRKRTAHN